MRPLSFVPAVLLALPSITLAQRADTDSVLHKGEWGAEVVLGPSITGASILRFVSSQTALVIGASASTSHYKQKFSGAFTGQSDSRTDIDARLGLRLYRSSATEHFHPVLGFGVRGIYQSPVSAYDSWTAGAYGELGAAYFFARHVSLGATGEVSVLHTKSTQESNGVTYGTTSTAFSASLVRVIASVYF